MTWQASLFLVLPVLSAAVIGLRLRRWQGAAAASLVALALVVLFPRVAPPDLGPLFPLLSGGALAGLVLTGLLLVRPGLPALPRVAIPAAAAFAAHFSFLQYAMATR